jgi:hypothetical protein
MNPYILGRATCATLAADPRDRTAGVKLESVFLRGVP